MDLENVTPYATVVMIGTLALWWFVFPEWPEIAVRDGIAAGAVASVLTGYFTRLF